MDKRKKLKKDFKAEDLLLLLQILHDDIKKPGFTLNGFASNNKIPLAHLECIKGVKLISVSGAGRATKYKWNTIPPNMHMAEELVKSIHDFYHNKAQKYNGKNKDESNVTKALIDSHNTSNHNLIPVTHEKDYVRHQCAKIARYCYDQKGNIPTKSEEHILLSDISTYLKDAFYNIMQDNLNN